MTVPNDVIERALRMLGYENPRRIVIDAFNVEWWEEPMNTEFSIHTDLASLLKRCRERGYPTLHDEGPLGDFMFSVMDRNGIWHDAANTDPTDALLAALAAAWDAKEKP